MDTNSVADKALSRAIDLLRAIKAEYIIHIPTQEPIVHGDLQLMPTKAAKQKRVRTVPHGTYTNMCRTKGVDKMKVGDVIFFTSDGLDTQRLRGVAAAMACKFYGNESVITTVNGMCVEMLRVK
jgi:hypothetical protein